MTASQTTRYRLDDLRGLATGLSSKVGLPPIRAAEFASYLLWFDAAGATSHGIQTLPTWLERIEAGQIDPKATGRAIRERPGTAIFDALGGIGPLAIEAASKIASEKARDVGIGLVRVENIGPVGPTAPALAHLAIGPYFGLVSGPGGSMAMALPMSGGLPSVFDSQLEPTDRAPTPPEEWMDLAPSWLSTLAGGDGWLVLAVSLAALRSMTPLPDRPSNPDPETAEGRGRLGSRTLEARRLEARERGVILGPASTTALKAYADRLGVAWPGQFVEGGSDGPAAG